MIECFIIKNLLMRIFLQVIFFYSKLFLLNHCACYIAWISHNLFTFSLLDEHFGVYLVVFFSHDNKTPRNIFEYAPFTMCQRFYQFIFQLVVQKRFFLSFPFFYFLWNSISVLRPPELGFPGGAVVENLPANAGDTGSSPGLGGSHMPRSN